jgi:hypothetical protein
MRRSLALTDEGARHPFRRSLPPHVRSGAQPRAMHSYGWFGMQDLRDFMLAYCACFLAVSLYIA